MGQRDVVQGTLERLILKILAFEPIHGYLIEHFPHPYPDEPLYGIIARMRERFPDPHNRGIGVSLFASSTATALSDFPHRLVREGSLAMRRVLL